MKNLRQISVSAVLTLVLAVAAAAGEIHTGIAPAPRVTEQSVAVSDVACDACGAPADTPAESQTVGEIALDFFQRVLALF